MRYSVVITTPKQLNFIKSYNIINDIIIKGDIELFKNEILDLNNKNFNIYWDYSELIFEKNIDKLPIMLKNLKKLNIFGVYITDLAIIEYIEDSKIDIKAIWNPKVGGNSINYYNFFKKRGSIYRVVISQELSFDTQIEYFNKIPHFFETVLYGYITIFHSGRKLITSLRENSNLKLENRVKIYEQKRENSPFLMEESENGTVIYNHSPISRVKEINSLKSIDFTGKINLSHITNFNEWYKNIDNFFKNRELYINENTIFNLPETGYIKKEKKLKIAAIVLESKRGKHIILRASYPIKTGDKILFFSDKGREIIYDIEKVENLGNDIIVIPWKKGIVSGIKGYFL